MLIFGINLPPPITTKQIKIKAVLLTTGFLATRSAYAALGFVLPSRALRAFCDMVSIELSMCKSLLSIMYSLYLHARSLHEYPFLSAERWQRLCENHCWRMS